MAVSPLILYNGGAESRASTAKDKSLAVRPSSNGVVQRHQPPPQDTRPELAEQLNEVEKQRYVKGRL